MMSRLAWVLCAAFGGLALGCGGDSDSDPGGNSGRGGGDTAGSSGASGATGGGRGGTSGVAGAGAGGVSGGTGGMGGVAGTPLLDAPAEVTYACEITRPMTLLGVNPWSNGGMFQSDAVTYLPRIEGDTFGGPGGMSVAWSALDMEGNLGSPRVVHTSSMEFLSQLTAAQAEDRFTLLWVNGSSHLPVTSAGLALAQVNGAGDVLTPRTLLNIDAESEPHRPRIAALGAGYGAVWGRSGETVNAIEFARLDADGVPLGDPALVVEGSGLLDPHDLVVHGSGFLLTYSQLDFVNSAQGTYYVMLDADGMRQGEPVRLSEGFGSTSVLRRSDRLLVAWTEQGGDFESETVNRTIRIGAIDAAGDRLGPTYALQAPVINQENVDPRFVDLGDDVGLFWSQGTVIYFCAGCFPDNHLMFTVFDGADFTRRAEVLELESPTQFGLRFPHAVRLDEDILVTADVTHHVDQEGASATVRCTP